MENKEYYFDNDLGSTVAEYKGFMNLDEFKKISNGAQIIRKTKKGSSLVIKVEDLKVLSKDIQSWINESFMPDRIKEGTLTSMIFIVPRSAIATLSMKSVNSKIEGVKMHYVGSMHSAKALVRTDRIINKTRS
jgi:hypothetical protein